MCPGCSQACAGCVAVPWNIHGAVVSLLRPPRSSAQGAVVAGVRAWAVCVRVCVWSSWPSGVGADAQPGAA